MAAPRSQAATLRSLSLRDFRNFERLELELPPDGLVLVGENGQGKTNLLEAAYYLSLLRSMRGARDADLIRFEASGFFLAGTICAPDTHELTVGFERVGRRKRVKRDGVTVERLSDALGTLPAVMFSPDDVELVAGSPAARRRFLDVMLALSSRAYLKALQLYRGALERRNAALRDALRRGARQAASIEVWDGPLAEHGAALIRSRRAWVGRTAPRFAAHCATIGEPGAVELRYEPGIDPNAESLEQALTDALASRRDADLRYGITHAGPHRDELGIRLDGRDLRTFGSAGQQRTAAIALRTLEAETLRESRDVSPVFLLDDPFAELDERRSTRVLRLLREGGLGQSILAVPRDTDIPPELSDLPRWNVKGGRIAAVGARSGT